MEIRRATEDDLDAMWAIFNYVVSTNTGAVRLYQQLRFTIVGTVPQAFRHETLGLVDIYVMHRFL